MSHYNPVTYKTYRDWELWRSHYEATAVNNNVWDYLRPDDPIPPPQRPALPSYDAFQASNAIIQAGATPTQLSDLSATGQRSYESAMERWEIQRDDRAEYHKGINTVLTWQTNTIHKSRKMLLRNATPQEVYEAVQRDAAPYLCGHAPRGHLRRV
ncbi:hypothetical protein SODALDRAFT_327765 [Sodiomyces alkalinus F11]|uniref:Uncharacterized protein n=1 Tax=Sodiomyces alkalinus (strain CBS 110278 / VKM F-3762 / F11) TaxID=1314773 RepID=A0A3N2Q9X1_SODAK|nr:hypothetical protein SODALDRAFT_327765 [Sodiomyces alkalinus F11]ROT43564.1 hypothetical protein SODALDRAFT_327765 [Sodiomyces alkalinus F11]